MTRTFDYTRAEMLLRKALRRVYQTRVSLESLSAAKDQPVKTATPPTPRAKQPKDKRNTPPAAAHDTTHIDTPPRKLKPHQLKE